MITTNMENQKNFYVTATTPSGPWSVPIWIEIPGLSIDPSLFFDDNGKVYLITSPNLYKPEGIALGEIDIKTGKLLTPMKGIWSGTVGSFPESPHISKKMVGII